MTVSPTWVMIQWASTAGFVLATIIMISPVVASTAITPWVIYLISNSIWMVDSIIRKNWPYAALSLFFSVWDVLLIASRMGAEVLVWLQPFVSLLERLP